MHICIDGTGDGIDRDYDREMQQSFVRRIFEETTDELARYVRGPTWFDLSKLTWGDLRGSTEEIAEWTAYWSGTHELKSERIFLVGYSRGAAACVRVAQLLKERGRQVEAMFLFDAVNWAREVHSEKIPNNVKTVWHALRIQKCFGNHSRWYFGHTAREYESSKTVYHEQFFNASHAALGGLPATGDIAAEVPFNYYTFGKLGDADPGGALTREYDFQHANEITVSKKVWDWMSHARQTERSDPDKLDTGTSMKVLG